MLSEKTFMRNVQPKNQGGYEGNNEDFSRTPLLRPYLSMGVPGYLGGDRLTGHDLDQ